MGDKFLLAYDFKKKNTQTTSISPLLSFSRMRFVVNDETFDLRAFISSAAFNAILRSVSRSFALLTSSISRSFKAMNSVGG